MKKAAALMMSLMLLLCSGCLNAHSLDRYGYVLAIGFDRGEQLPYKITLMLQNMQLKDGSEKSAGFTLVSAECRGLYDAIESLSGRLPYVLDFSRAMMLVFAQELVREAGVLDELISVSFSRLHIRYNANIYVALSDAAAVFEGMENEMEPNLSKIQMNHMLYARSTGLVPVTNLTNLQEAIHQKYEDMAIPVCGNAASGDAQASETEESGYQKIGGTPLVSSEMKTGLAGAALFSDSRMVGLIDGEQTQLMLMALGEFQGGRIRLDHGEKGETSLLVSADAGPEITLSLGETPRVKVSVQLHAILEQPESVDQARLEEIDAALEGQLKHGLYELFTICRTLESDAMGFGRCAVRQFATAEDWEAYDWDAAYRALDATFSVSVEMDQAAVKTVLE